MTISNLNLRNHGVIDRNLGFLAKKKKKKKNKAILVFSPFPVKKNDWVVTFTEIYR